MTTFFSITCLRQMLSALNLACYSFSNWLYSSFMSSRKVLPYSNYSSHRYHCVVSAVLFVFFCIYCDIICRLQFLRYNIILEILIEHFCYSIKFRYSYIFIILYWVYIFGMLSSFSFDLIVSMSTFFICFWHNL